MTGMSGWSSCGMRPSRSTGPATLLAPDWSDVACDPAPCSFCASCPMPWTVGLAGWHVGHGLRRRRPTHGTHGVPPAACLAVCVVPFVLPADEFAAELLDCVTSPLPAPGLRMLTRDRLVARVDLRGRRLRTGHPGGCPPPGRSPERHRSSRHRAWSAVCVVPLVLPADEVADELLDCAHVPAASPRAQDVHRDRLVAGVRLRRGRRGRGLLAASSRLADPLRPAAARAAGRLLGGLRRAIGVARGRGRPRSCWSG